MTEPIELPRGFRLLHRYIIDGRVAAGGMATIYRAHDERLERSVCVKLLRLTLEGSGSTAGNKVYHATYQHFHQEALALSRLQHPNTLRIFDFGYLEESGRPFQVSEFLEGGTLDERVRREGPWSPAQCALLLERIAGAVSEAHAHGIVHRDIKPSNILFAVVGDSLIPKLADFGIAHGDLKPANAKEETSVSSVALFSPRWAAPEQLAGDYQGSLTDIYALGLTVHFALTGKPLFEGRDVRHTFKDRVDGNELVGRILDHYHLPPSIHGVLQVALAVNPADRHRTPEVLATEFLIAAESVPSGSRALERSSLDTLLSPSLAEIFVADRVDLTLPLAQEERVRITFLPSAGGEHTFRVNLKGLSCLLRLEGGRPTPALHLDRDAVVELVSSSMKIVGQIGCSFGLPNPNGRRFPLQGGTEVLLPFEKAHESVALYFGSKSEGMLLYRRL